MLGKNLHIQKKLFGVHLFNNDIQYSLKTQRKDGTPSAPYTHHIFLYSDVLCDPTPPKLIWYGM